MKTLGNEKGFTLIEMLLVLFIVILFSSIAMKISFHYTEKNVTAQFLNQVELDILTTQAKAIEKQERIELKFTVDQYSMFNEYGDTYLERRLPKGITFNMYSNLKGIKFSPFGEVSEFGSLRFRTTDGEKALIINIHKGRIRYEQ